MNTSEYISYKFDVSNLSVDNTSYLSNSVSSLGGASTNSSINTSASSFRSNSSANDRSSSSFASSSASSLAASSCSSCRICSNGLPPTTKPRTRKDGQLKELKTELHDLIANLKNDLNLNFSHLNYEQALLNAKLSTIQCYLKVVYKVKCYRTGSGRLVSSLSFKFCLFFWFDRDFNFDRQISTAMHDTSFMQCKLNI
jgi:hypothetical protein